MCSIKRSPFVRSVLALVKATHWWKTHRPTARRLAQLYCALLYNAHIKGFLSGEIYTGKLKALCTPGLNCYSCPGAVAACPLGALQNAISASGTRAGTYVLGILLLFGLTVGRTICGWLCPFGMLQELVHKIPSFKIRKSRVTRALSYLKYGILIVFVIAIPLWYGLARGLPVPGFCKYLCPAGTFEGAVGLLSSPSNAGLFPMLGKLFTRKYAILILVGLSCVFCYRAFCRFLCPLGAIYGLFNGISVIGVRTDGAKCTQCGACTRACPMDIRQVGDRECIHCGQCAGVCGTHAISMRCGRRDILDTKNTELKHALQGFALSVLLFLILWVNWLSPQARTQASAPPQAENTVEIGCEIGQQLPEFSLETMNNGIFSLSDTRGKPVFINLWATYCAPCVKELPYFSRLHSEHPEIEVLAVHSSLVTEDVRAYLEGRDWNLTFAIDTDDDLLYTAVGASSVLPQTIVLNTAGQVIYNQTGSVTYEQLVRLLEEAK